MICRSLVKHSHLRTQEAGGERENSIGCSELLSPGPRLHQHLLRTLLAGNGDWASRQMLDSFPFVFTWKLVKVKLQADCWLLLELITMKRNTISCEKTWKA